MAVLIGDILLAMPPLVYKDDNKIQIGKVGAKGKVGNH